MIHFKSHSGIFTLETSQELPISIEQAWKFFSDPANLVKITPMHMRFEITSGTPQEMYQGQIISYKVSPFPGIRTNWVTEITHVDQLKYFVDEQRFGPYAMWHHEHWFEAVDGGINMKDKVSYKVPFGPLGRIAQQLIIKKQLRSVFNYRRQILNELFPG